MCPCVSAGCWYMIWCWHWLPWERKRDKERRSLTSYWTLSRTVGISIGGKYRKWINCMWAHEGITENYKIGESEQWRCSVLCSSDTLLCCFWTVCLTIYIKSVLFFWLFPISWRHSGVSNKVEQSVSAQWLAGCFAVCIQITRQENADKGWIIFIGCCKTLTRQYFFLSCCIYGALLKLLLLQ